MYNLLRPVARSGFTALAVLTLFAGTSAHAAPAQYDLNADGIIDGGDVFVLRSCFGQPAQCNPQADFDESGTIDIADYRELLQFYGETVDQELLINAVVDRLSAPVDTDFGFSVDVIQTSAGQVDFEWTTDDGQQARGAAVSFRFDTPGIRAVTVNATGDDGSEASQLVTLYVIEQGSLGPAELGLPDLYGDVDGDGVVTLRDALLAARSSGDLTTLSDDGENSADLNFEDGVTVQDANLIAEALLDAAPLPNRLLVEQGAPAAAITIVSPALLDTSAALYTVQVGNSSQPQELFRIAQGYGNFIVPFDPTTPNSIVVQPGPITVELRRDGVVVDTYTLELLAPPVLPPDPKAEVMAIIDLFDALLDRYEEETQSYLDLVGVDGIDAEILLGTLRSAQTTTAESLAGLRELLDGPQGPALAEYLLRIGGANGFADIRSELENVLSASPAQLQNTDVCGTVLPAYCGILTLAATLDSIGGWVELGCDVLRLAIAAAILFPGDGVLLDAGTIASWLALCAPTEAAIAVASVVTGLVSSFDADLRLDVETPSLRAGESTTVTTAVEFAGLDDVCGIGAGRGAEYVVNQIAERAVAELLRRNFGQTAMRKVFEARGGTFLNDLLMSLTDIVGQAIDTLGVSQAVELFTNNVCDLLGVGGELPADANGILQAPEPNVGMLMFNGDGTATYTCPDPVPEDQGEITLTAQKQICDDDVEKMADVSCAAEGMVTITMGDNGNLNDDIYEVVIDGETVLTSSQPVRSISTTVQLPEGQTTVQMIGRAAPDGIGTYFIQFTGDVTNVSGDALSGTDLTPGVTKTFVITVELPAPAP